jgi:hypothetical protein
VVSHYKEIFDQRRELRDISRNRPGQGELNISTLLPLDFNHAAINDDFSASYKTRGAKKQREIRSDADLDGLADFFESTLAGIRMAAKAGKSRHALRNIAAFASRAYMASDRRITPE